MRPLYINPYRNVGTDTSDAADGSPSRALQEDGWEIPMEITQVSKEIKPYIKKELICTMEKQISITGSK